MRTVALRHDDVGGDATAVHFANEDALDLALTAIYTAADEDTATGGPDAARGIYPIVATITDEGFQRVDDDELATRSAVVVDRLTGGGGDSA